MKLFIFQKVRNELIIINNKSVQLFYLIIMMNLLFHLVFVMNLLFHLFSKIVFHKLEYIQRSATTLSQHIWELKNKNIEYDLSWKIIGRAKPFSPVTGVCALCTLEKYFILTSESGATLNRNYEIFKPCIHRIHLLLDKT